MIDNLVITDSNRGIAFMVFDGGIVEDVVMSNITIDTKRFDWFWWGDGDPLHFNIKRRNEVDGTPPKEKEPAAGSIRNVLLRNIIAHGQGASAINGHPDSWLNGIQFEGVKLFVGSDPKAAFESNGARHCGLRYARKRVVLRDFEIHWEKPAAASWQRPMSMEDVEGISELRLGQRRHPRPVRRRDRSCCATSNG